ncbi:MAG: PEGA domain-containing protein [Polyangiaceae bacterium]
MVKKLMAESQKHVLTLQLKADVAGASVSVDGIEVGKTPLESAVYLDAGMHVIAVRKDGYVTADRKLNAAAGTTDTWEVTMQPDATKSMVAAGNASAGANVNPFQESPHDGAASKPNPWILVGGGVVTAGAVVAGLVFSSKASSAKDDAEKKQAQHDSSYCDDPSSNKAYCSSLKNDAQDVDRNRNLSTASFLVGGVAAVGTLVYWLWPRSKVSTGTGQFPGCAFRCHECYGNERPLVVRTLLNERGEHHDQKYTSIPVSSRCCTRFCRLSLLQLRGHLRASQQLPSLN